MYFEIINLAHFFPRKMMVQPRREKEDKEGKLFAEKINGHFIVLPSPIWRTVVRISVFSRRFSKIEEAHWRIILRQKIE